MTAAVTDAETASVLSPLYFELTIHGDAESVIDTVWKTATWSVPFSQANLTVGSGKKQQLVAQTRRLLIGTSKTHSHLVRLCDTRTNDPQGVSFNRWRWQAELLQEAFDPATNRVSLRLEVSRFRVSGGCVQQATELALFRHLLVAALLNHDPDLAISGDQTHWDESWWPVELTW
jgi:hypothetical protein